MKDLINEYYNSNDLKEKLELKRELLKNSNSQEFKVAVMSHYDAYKNSNEKLFLDAMLQSHH
ncbi:hypothetical protein [Winogradskyella endarachnes]|uniref:Uncharacterized protein n=1 Tax=Winogradskyella endarachnes TaxID=2681965 RepID=A0A6L6UGC0_9FLAO|nr:hypothetical protein [Winogradskyella endarachnes]MUU79814.1 hypothetical protein [Winogradskyella endarachnes]